MPRIWILFVSMILVTGLLGWQAVSLWEIKKGRFLNDGKLKMAVAEQQQTGMSLEHIADVHLFGNPADVPPPAAVPVALPQTDLKLILIGAITDSDGQKASALIDAERATKRYFVGDSIPGGAILHEVQADAVVLKRENRYEVLSFLKGGEIAPYAKAQLDKLRADAAANSSQVSAVPSTPPQASQPQQPPAATPAGNKKTGATSTGLTLRERFKQTPRNNQKAPVTQ